VLQVKLLDEMYAEEIGIFVPTMTVNKMSEIPNEVLHALSV